MHSRKILSFLFVAFGFVLPLLCQLFLFLTQMFTDQGITWFIFILSDDFSMFNAKDNKNGDVLIKSRKAPKSTERNLRHRKRNSHFAYFSNQRISQYMSLKGIYKLCHRNAAPFVLYGWNMPFICSLSFIFARPL